jgi:maleate cis-trans isomerase
MSAPAATAAFRALDVERTALISALEEDLRRPVLTANQVSLWYALRVAGAEVGVDDYGQLFTMPCR